MTEQVPAAQETIGQRLKRLRLERGFSQRELAAPGVSYAYISRIEAGTRQPSVKALRRLAAKLGVTAEYLETGSQLAPADDRELRLSELELAVRLGDWQGKEEALEAVLDEALEAADSETALRARVSLAIVAQEHGDLHRVVEFLEESLEGEPFAPVERPALYIQLGKAYLATGRPDAAVNLYERCLAAVREAAGPPSTEARFAASLSVALSEVGDVGRAESVVQEAVARSRDVRDLATGVRIYWSLARVAHAEGKPGLALANIRRAISLLETTEATSGLARAHLLATSIAISRDDADEAATHLDYASRLLGAAPSFPDSAALRVKRAQVAALRGDGSAAVGLAHEALEAIGDRLPEERGAALAALAEGLALTGADDDSHDAYSQAVEVLVRQRRWREATQVCRSWARMLRAAGREQEALDVLDRAAELGLRAAPAESR